MNKLLISISLITSCVLLNTASADNLNSLGSAALAKHSADVDAEPSLHSSVDPAAVNSMDKAADNNSLAGAALAKHQQEVDAVAWPESSAATIKRTADTNSLGNAALNKHQQGVN